MIADEICQERERLAWLKERTSEAIAALEHIYRACDDRDLALLEMLQTDDSRQAALPLARAA